MGQEIKSPCIKVCKYDEESVCMGCYRSMKEVTSWIFMNNEQKQEALDNAAVRKATPRSEKNDYEHYV